MSATTALQVADWRRRVFGPYERVRSAPDGAAAHAEWRHERDDLSANHPSSPLLPEDQASFTGLPVADYDPAWRFEVEISAPLVSTTLDHQNRRIEVETGTDGIVPFDLLGVAEIPGVGSLDIWRLASYGGGLFVPVRDGLAGIAGGTYGGGRYVLDTVKGADLGPGAAPDTIVLDFNFAYNPSCAYDPAWACPLAQPGNTVATEIPVGERYSGAH